MAEDLHVRSQHRDDWLDITAALAERVRAAGLRDGVVSLFVPHTTAAITVQENADPPLKEDINAALSRLFPRAGPPGGGTYGHCEDNAASHLKALCTGSSLQIPVRAGKLQLGTWQSVYLCEFDGPRSRRVQITCLPSGG